VLLFLIPVIINLLASHQRMAWIDLTGFKPDRQEPTALIYLHGAGSGWA
jgi:hypothetical protein